MEEVATQAANKIIAESSMGAIAVILAISFLALLIYHFRETGRLHGENDTLQTMWREETKTSTGSVLTALQTVAATIDILTKRNGS